MVPNTSVGTPRNHSLDTLRIIAEFWVVLMHIQGFFGDLPDSQKSVTGLVTADLMSLFFVLSGAVICMSHPEPMTTWREVGIFCWNKTSKSFPLYFVVCLFQLVNDRVGTGMQDQYPILWMCYMADLFSLSPWFMCNNLGKGVQGVGWYLSVILWLWFFFGVFNGIWHKWLDWIVTGYPWKMWVFLVILYVVANALSLVSIWPGMLDYSHFPPIRFVEFFMGMIVGKRILAYRGRRVDFFQTFLVVIVLISMCVIWGVFFWLAEAKKELEVIHDWDYRMYSVSYDWKWKSHSHTKMTLHWAVIVLYLGSRPHMMEGGVTKSLNMFSLQVYLLHQVLGYITLSLSSYVPGMPQLWNTTVLMVWVYWLSYLFYRNVQGYLDASMNSMYRVCLGGGGNVQVKGREEAGNSCI